MQCDLCGTEEENLVSAIVEGTELNVCRNCARYGKIVEKKIFSAEQNNNIRQITSKEPEKQTIEVIVPDFADKIKKKREQLGIKQKDFAKKLSLKESLVHNLETGSFEPSIDIARKLERFLKIKLVEEYEDKKTETMKLDSNEITIGDLIKIKS
ncbi:MAG: multiprotein bridging factor aMBF1 [Candidatus Nanoarchaeia archaeon]|nr:multiprotein bridging factor aMBF1 [Candidatus Nanoarchaeia archaeon]